MQYGYITTPRQVNMNLNEPDAKHTCITCGKTYKHKHHLKRHHDFECGIDPKFKCSFCPHKTRYKDSLLKHILARHQKFWKQSGNSASGQTSTLDVLTEIDVSFHAAPMLNTYTDFS